jgi:enterochelin esterase-like enzyme
MRQYIPFVNGRLLRRSVLLATTVAVCSIASSCQSINGKVDKMPIQEKGSFPSANEPLPLSPPQIIRSCELGPDDKQVFPEPPDDFVAKRESIAHGKLETIEYDSKTVGARRKMMVYTPPNYSTSEKYPVLYLLHGFGGDETEWQRFAHLDDMFDNLVADGKIVPTILVMPNGRAQANGNPDGDITQAIQAFQNFEGDLINDVIPTIEMRYSTLSDRQHRALAGLSMGGGQTAYFGFKHLDRFAWIGIFSAAPNSKTLDRVIVDPAAAAKRLNLLWLSCGSNDPFFGNCQETHRYLNEKNLPHVWNVDGHAHDDVEWRNNVYWFAQKLFR